MECRPLEIKLISANDIWNVNRFTTMNVYCFVQISGDPRRRQKSPTDRYAGTSPRWNYNLHFTVDESDLQKGHLTLVFHLRSERYLGDRDIGEVQIPLKDLLDHHKDHRAVTYELSNKSGRQKGTLEFSYLFGDKFVISANPSAYGRSKTMPVQGIAEEDESESESKFGLGLGAALLGLGGLFVAADTADDAANSAAAAVSATAAKD